MTRLEIRATEKLAAFWYVWEMFLVSWSRYYIPGQDMNIDEQLVPFSAVHTKQASKVWNKVVFEL